MGARFLRPKRLLTLALLAISVAVAVWWLGYIPYDPLAIYRPIPASATLVGRHLQLPARWNDLLANPLARALMRTAGVRTEDAAGLVADEESRIWFEKLAGREGTLAYLPSRYGGAPTWMAVSHLGGESQKLRWQLSLFRVPGFHRMTQFPGRSVWQVDSPELEPGQHLVIAFGEGVLLACLSDSPLAIAEVLAAYDGQVPRLMEEEPAFKEFAEADGRDVPDRLWIRDESEFAAEKSPGVTVEIPALRGDSLSLSAATEGAGLLVPEDRAATTEIGALARVLGDAPCAAALVQREALLRMLSEPGLQRDSRHAVRWIADVSTDRVAVVFMDGDMGGRLAWGAMGALGLSGLRVPTVLLATPVADEVSAAEAIQRALDASNARYRAAFVLQPVPAPPATIYVLESAGGDEWVDELSRSDRPAYMVLDGWLLASSNLSALQKLAQAPAEGRAGAPMPAWAAQVDRPAAVAAWLDLARSGKIARDAIATWSMAQMFMNRGNSQAIREQLNEIKVWIDAFAPFGEARAELGRRQGQTVLDVDLGLSGAGRPE
jgi:hypothetical protein